MTCWSLIISTHEQVRGFTWKSVGSPLFQLRVHPTIGSNRLARNVANLLTVSVAVWLFGFLPKGINVRMKNIQPSMLHLHHQLFNKWVAQEPYIMVFRAIVRKWDQAGAHWTCHVKPVSHPEAVGWRHSTQIFPSVQSIQCSRKKARRPCSCSKVFPLPSIHVSVLRVLHRVWQGIECRKHFLRNERREQLCGWTRWSCSRDW